MDWWKKLFNDPATLGIIVTSGVIGLVVSIGNGIIQKKHGGWSGFFGAIFIGTSIAVIVGLGTKDYISSEAARLAIIGACAVVSDDIWAGLKSLGSGMRSDPLGTIGRIIDALRGKPSVAKE